MVGVEDNRYAHLLQPIRDLAGNWDINIADELEEYMVGFRPTTSQTGRYSLQTF